MLALFFTQYVRSTPAAWRIAADYRTDTFIWSVSGVILSSLTPVANNPAPSPLAALAGGLWGRQRQRWNILRLNLKPFVCCCLHLECAREWAVERPSLGLRGAHMGAPPLFRGVNMLTHSRTPSLYPHSITVPLFSMSNHDWGRLLSKPFVPRAPASHIRAPFHPHTPLPLLSRKHDKHLLFLCRSCVRPRRLSLLPPLTE